MADGVLDSLLEGFSSSSGGVVAKPTWEKTKRAGQRQAAKAKGKGSGGGKDSQFESKHPRGQTGSSQGGKFVRKGSTGSDVKAVQRRVGAKTDGQFGDRTRHAVKRFQRAHGLTADGVVGHATALALAGKHATKAQEGRLRKGDLDAVHRPAKTTPTKTAKPPRAGRSGAPRRSGGGRLV